MIAWHSVQGSGGDYVILEGAEPGGRAVALVHREEDAALIVKAPEMLELLERDIRRGHRDTCDFVTFDVACYACTCGHMDARALLSAVEGLR